MFACDSGTINQTLTTKQEGPPDINLSQIDPLVVLQGRQYASNREEGEPFPVYLIKFFICRASATWQALLHLKQHKNVPKNTQKRDCLTFVFFSVRCALQLVSYPDACDMGIGLRSSVHRGLLDTVGVSRPKTCRIVWVV